MDLACENMQLGPFFNFSLSCAIIADPKAI
jgi:hypothetical protein